MALAAAETIFNNGYVPVAINGTWLKISYIFLNGVVTAIGLDTGKVVDAKILSQKCLCNFNSDVHSNECSASYIENSWGMEVEEFERRKNLRNKKSIQEIHSPFSHWSLRETLNDFAFSGVEVTTAFRVISTSNRMTFCDVTSGLSVTVTSGVIWGTTHEFTFGLAR
ncbi:hypothetical protein TNCV_4860951 [Trichonephila clavipes]|nr:hypothetical protein TNCV_4860951 [Trichonephila clavipes]